MQEFAYQEPFPLGPDPTRYRLLTPEYVSIGSFEGRELLKVAPEALALLAREAFREVSHRGEGRGEGGCGIGRGLHRPLIRPSGTFSPAA